MIGEGPINCQAYSFVELDIPAELPQVIPSVFFPLHIVPHASKHSG